VDFWLTGDLIRVVVVEFFAMVVVDFNHSGCCVEFGLQDLEDLEVAYLLRIF